MTKVPLVELHNGHKIPAIGYGVGSAWRVKKTNNNDKSLSAEEKLKVNEIVVHSIEDAINTGFRHLDVAEAYFTRKEVAAATNNLAQSVPRNELFITDKYSNANWHKDQYIPLDEALETALQQLDTPYLDLWMLHALREHPNSNTIEERWASLEKAYNEGKVKALGASNCSLESVQRIFKVAKIKPHVLQLYYHALCQHYYDDLIAFARENNVVIEAYSPLAPITQTSEVENKPQQELLQFLQQLSKKYNRTESQILLRWTYEQGFVPVTTTSKKERIKQSLEIFEFELEKDDKDKITEIGKNSRDTFKNISVKQ